MEKPEVDSIEGLSPAISINQQANRFSPRSTVGTATEIYDYLRVLFARVGIPQCPEHKVPLDSKTITEVVESILSLPEGTRIFLLAPVVRDRKGEHEQLIRDLARQGYVRLRVDETLYEIENVPPLDKYFTHTIEVIVDRLVVRDSNRQRLVESVEAAAALSDGIVSAHQVSKDGMMESEGTLYSTKFGCPYCGYVLDELEPRIFSFNNPKGACKFCNGLGYLAKIDPDKLVEEPALSLSCGAIPGWDRKAPTTSICFMGLPSSTSLIWMHRLSLCPTRSNKSFFTAPAIPRFSFVTNDLTEPNIAGPRVSRELFEITSVDIGTLIRIT